MIGLASYAELVDRVGQDLGSSSWMTIDQRLIDRFADVTGDHFWVHTDVERASRELPGGRTIAHGLLTFSLIPKLLHEIIHVEDDAQTFSYGADRLRYVAPVSEGEAVRLSVRVESALRKADLLHLTLDYVVEIRGSDTPALVARQITVTAAPSSLTRSPA